MHFLHSFDSNPTAMLHQKIRQLREQHHLRDEDMAERLCMSQSAYSRLETGVTKMDVERLRKIAEVLEVQLDDLFIPVLGAIQPDTSGQESVFADPTPRSSRQALLQRIVDLYTEQMEEVQAVNARYARMTVRILALLRKAEG
jgi:transcriptional regulator with XRE-family HTH domain